MANIFSSSSSSSLGVGDGALTSLDSWSALECWDPFLNIGSNWNSPRVLKYLAIMPLGCSIVLKYLRASWSVLNRNFLSCRK